MIPGASIAVLDDNEDHLRKLVSTLNSLGCAALPVLYRDGQAQIETPLNTLQLVFVDINLVPGNPQGPATYDIVLAALERIIAQDCGPYILISWSTHSGLHDELMNHFAENLDEGFPAPAASARLDKNRYLNGADDLTAGVQEAVGLVPQVSGLLGWQDAARIAAGEVVNSMLKLTEHTERYAGTNGPALEKLLTAIAREGGGANAILDLSAAMNEGFGPILTDRLMHGTAANRERLNGIWSQAVPNASKAPSLDDQERAALNTMTAISTHDIEHVQAGSRGAVCKLPEALRTEEGFCAAFGCSPEQAVDFFVSPKTKEDRASKDLTKPQWQELRKRTARELVEGFKLVGLSAACDHAWGKVPVKKLLLALEVPASALGDFELARSDSCYQTPRILFPDGSRNGHLFFNWRYYWATSSANVGVEVDYRIREPLMSHLTTNYHVHGFRPGIPNF